MGRTGLSRRHVLLGAAASGLGTLSPGRPHAAPNELRFGLTPVFLTSDLELLARLRAYLERSTGRSVKLVTRRTYQEITALLVSGQLDAAWICGFPFVAYRPQLALIAVPLWLNRPLYRSYLIAGADRPVTGIGDLRGDIHAFSDPDSNSGWLVTAAALADLKTSPERFFKQSFFTFGHRNVIRAVASNLAFSGSVDGYVYDVMREAEPDLVAQTRIVRTSEWLGFPPIACPATLADDAGTVALRRALLAMGTDPDGQAVLQMLRLDGFGEADPSIFDPIAAKVALVRGSSG